MIKKIFTVLIIVLIIVFSSIPAFAHGGKTDINGGHKDNQNKSGLGSYHYHCNGYPAHLHEDGICPYIRAVSSDLQSTEAKVATTAPTAENNTTEEAKGKASTDKNNVVEGMVFIILICGVIVLCIAQKRE